jgi:molybdopterin-guanine dinucleotide biosynthesis protein A
MRLTGIILAGGQSRRMGQDKALMMLGGRTLIQRVRDALAPLCDELVLVTNAPEKFLHLGLRTTTDLFPNAGSLGGLYSGLTLARHELSIAVACDMPFLNTDLLRYLASLADEADAVVPDLSESSTSPQTTPPLLQGEGRVKAKQLDLHPLHAVYRRACLAPIEAQLHAGDLRMMGFFAQVRTRYVNRADIVRYDPALRSFFNVNTPEEWAVAESLVNSEQSSVNSNQSSVNSDK